MSRCPTAIATWLQRCLTPRNSVARSPARCRSAVTRPVFRAVASTRNVHSSARRSAVPQPASSSSSHHPVSSLLPRDAYDALVARLGQHATHRELRWMIQAIIRTPLTQLHTQPTHPTTSLSALLRTLSARHQATLNALLSQRAAGTPLQYVLGDVVWCGLSVLCQRPVLIPRPETEEMVEWLCAVMRPGAGRRYGSADDWLSVRPAWEDSITARGVPGAGDAGLLPELRVLDLCTGSGCISLALAAHLGCTTVGTDIAPEALQLAADNTAHITSQLPPGRTLHSTFLNHNLHTPTLSPPTTHPPPHNTHSQSTHQPFHVVISNPPYVPTGAIATLQTEVACYESWLALDGGVDGTALYGAVAALAARVLVQGGGGGGGGVGWPELVVEIGGDEQRVKVMECFRAAGFVQCVAVADRAGRTRWIAGRRE